MFKLIASALLTLFISYPALADNARLFWKDAAKAIADTLNYDRNYFRLYWRQHEDKPFYIYSYTPSKPLQIKCSKSAYYDIASANPLGIVGWINIGVCENNPQLSSEILQKQQNYMLNLVHTISHKPVDTSTFPYETFNMDGNIKTDIFTFIAIGHGIGLVQTAITTNKHENKVVIVQFYGQYLCTRLPNLLLCSDPNVALTKLSSAIINE